MILRYIIPLLALVGIISGILFTTTRGNPTPPPPQQLAEPPATPYDETVSGTGIVEANSRNIQVGSHLSGVVAKLLVTEGQGVEANTPLFILDTRAAEADLAEAKAAIASAEAALADERDQLKRAEALKPGTSISVDTLQRRRFAVKRAEAALAQATARANGAETHLNRHTIIAPIAGKILKIRLREGEFVTAGNPQAPIVMGNDTPLHLRVAVDENDLWRYTPSAKAVATLRSNKELSFPLTFVAVEPLVLPKRDLSGDTTERVDTRVLEAIYSFTPSNQPIYIGQQMDVFIEAE